MKRKVFGIGLNKTGTSTLGACLTTLGYRHRTYNFRQVQRLRMQQMDALMADYADADSFDDWPTPWLYQQLDAAFPGSLFILTRRRSTERWLASITDHALRTRCREGMVVRNTFYGCPYPQIDAELYRRTYENHNAAVRHHFRGRPQQLLELCWEEDNDWTRLCGFLGDPIPATPLPHINAGAGQRERRNRLVNKVSWRVAGTVQWVRDGVRRVGVKRPG